MMEQLSALLLQQVMEVSDQLSQNDESSEQVRQSGGSGAMMDGSDLERLRGDANLMVGETGLGRFALGQDDFNEDECKKS